MFYFDISRLLCTFACKFTKFIRNMQGKREELTNVGLQTYAKGLSAAEQMKLKAYVAMKFGKSYITINDKFNGSRSFTAVELLALQSIIEQEQWRQ